MDRGELKTAGTERILLGCDSAMKVSIQSYKDRIPCGLFVSLYDNIKYEFFGLDQMLLMMEDIMDSVGTPRPVYEHRSLYDAPYAFCEPASAYAGGTKGILHLPRGKASFVLRFCFRQHGSLQGELVALPARRQQKKIRFRSALELMRMLYEYLDMEIGEQTDRRMNG